MWIQRGLRLPPVRRGFHLITDDLLKGIPELGQIDVGILHQNK